MEFELKVIGSNSFYEENLTEPHEDDRREADQASLVPLEKGGRKVCASSKTANHRQGRRRALISPLIPPRKACGAADEAFQIIVRVRP